ncbi:excinuclease ABC subunit A [Klebsiella pneumoniae]|nr:excinuclease ABC subunit A [Klebsiella pneumoniae]
MDKIEVRGARTHNLKNINLVIPRDKLIVVTGLSGSGKSSLAFDTLYAEGQRRYVESLSAYARQFLSLMEKPDVDHIEGLSPAISIEQKSTSHNPRSTVGTITEIHDYLRLLYARVGEPRCPDHDVPLAAQTVSQMVDNVLAQPEGLRLMLLAPIIKERKGEHTKTLENLASQGYIRARIDGEVCDLSDPPKLELQKKHTIEVVIDRFKVRDDLAQRLAESFETALELSGGTAIVANMDDEKAEELLFSANFACPICGYSMRELEPRLFSFNNPAGACPTCDGLGVQQYFDPDRVVQNPELSLAGGAIRGWDRRNFYYFQMLKSLAEHYKFDVEAPWGTLSANVQKVVLYGSGKESIEFKYMNDRGDTSVRRHPFEGVLHNMERRYKETESSAVREELAKFISNRPCASCDGTRLRREARHVFVENTPLPTISDMSIGHAMDFFNNLKLSGQRAKIAEKVLKEIGDRLKFLVNVGLNYLTLSRSAETLSGGEAQRIRLASQIGAGLVGVMYVLDEPSIGLHQRDNERLLGTLIHLRNLGNTVIVVEHDEDAIRAADHVIDIGPGAGVHGGQVVAEGPLEAIMAVPESLTGQFMSGKRKIEVPKQRVPANPEKVLKLTGARGNNLKDVTLTLPVGLFTCITGVSGSGKSTLINDTLFPIAQRQLNGATIASDMSIGHAMDFFNNLKLSGQRAKIAEKVLKEIGDRLKFLVNVGLNYLTLSRSAETLSGGEAQRIRLASQIGAGLVGVMYVLDEPSIGLHQRDNERLLGTLIHLRNLGNTVIVVEHDEDAIRAADHVIDIGPGAGVHGGQVVAEGPLEAIMAVPESLTGQFMSGKRKIEVPKQRVPANPEKVLKLTGARGNNLKDVTLTLPVGLFTCITGVSGSGKSTLINDTLFPIAQRQLNGATIAEPAPYRDIQGLEHFDKVIDIDQSPIGRTPRSNPATYTGVFTPVRELFAGVPESRSRGYTPGRFSFNVRGGRCEACQGDGVIKVEMHFLPDIYVPCDQCKGKRYNRETLEIKYKGKTIHEVLDMTIEEAREFFDAVPALARKLQTLMDVGLTYIRLGQSATTLSGGEAQRVKLARELSKRGTGQTLYILDEPTTGLHFADIQQLLEVLHQLRDQGNTIVVIEHNLDVIKTADWIVDLGPEGGSGGGEILVSGTPETVAECEASHTARFLKPMLK